MSVLNKSNQKVDKKESGNQLFPVFLKLNELKVLLVGAGNVGLEKLTALLSNSPDTHLTIVAERVLPEVYELVSEYSNISLNCRQFEESDLEGQDIIVIATGDHVLNSGIRELARKRHLLINVADKPELCDFYLGSIVKKGDLKIGISTNGKSPTIAKRLKEVFHENLPDGLDITLQQMNRLRDTLRGDFAHKVNELNKATAGLVESAGRKKSDKKMVILWCVLAFIVLTLSLVWLTSSGFRSDTETSSSMLNYFPATVFILKP